MPQLFAQSFVYYRVSGLHLSAAAASVHALHARWRAEDPTLVCELMRRIDDDRDDLVVTLMEVYRRADGVTPAWQQRVESEAHTALSPWLVGERHVEVFAPCA